ncbi:UNVERIFIED_ORG: hypothetical protein HNP28_003224 [Comamonas terrigena]
MSIRTNKKDHREKIHKQLYLVPSKNPSNGNHLKFWTSHPSRPCLVDLTKLNDGVLVNSDGRFKPFSGRPTLILQLAPAIREISLMLSPAGVESMIKHMRNWWRVFDHVEKNNAQVDAEIFGVENISEIHRQAAIDLNFVSPSFFSILRVINITRLSQGLRQLHWVTPKSVVVKRKLPPFENIKIIRNALKHKWYESLDRWERVEQLMAGSLPKSEEEASLIHNRKLLQLVALTTGKVWPSSADYGEVCGEHITGLYRKGLRINVAMKCIYPDPETIYSAFHLCLATTGWNPSTLIGLNVDDLFLEIHPKDESRYLLKGYKERAGSYQFSEGLLKSQSSVGYVLKTLITRTKPLREQLRSELQGLIEKLNSLKRSNSDLRDIDDLRKKIIDLEKGVRSPWLYVVSTTRGISWLTDMKYGKIGNNSFLDSVVSQINEKRNAKDKISSIVAGDFRDAYAAFVYKQSGGMILQVMRALGHKRPYTTQRYIDNSLLNEEGVKMYRNFSDSLWEEIRLTGRVDPSVIAKYCRDGDVTSDERERLNKYRDIKRSRLGIGCKSPHNPPRKYRLRLFQMENLCALRKGVHCV